MNDLHSYVAVMLECRLSEASAGKKHSFILRRRRGERRARRDNNARAASARSRACPDRYL